MGVTLRAHFVLYLFHLIFPLRRSWRRARTRTKLWTSVTTRTSTEAHHRRSLRTKRATSKVCTASITVRKRWTYHRRFDWPRDYTPWTASKSLTSLDILAKSTYTLYGLKKRPETFIRFFRIISVGSRFIIRLSFQTFKPKNYLFFNYFIVDVSFDSHYIFAYISYDVKYLL